MVNVSMTRVLALVALVALLSPAALVQAQTGVERKVLLQEDLSVPGQQVSLIAVTIELAVNLANPWTRVVKPFPPLKVSNSLVVLVKLLMARYWLPPPP